MYTPGKDKSIYVSRERNKQKYLTNIRKYGIIYMGLYKATTDK